MVLFVIALLFLGIGLFCRRQTARWLLWGASIFFAVGGLGLVWPDMYYAAQGCAVTDGALSCPTPPTLVLRLAMMHQIAAQLVLAAGVFAAPAVTLIALWLERRFRRVGDGKAIRG